MPLDYLLAYPKPTEESPGTYTPLSILFPGAMWEAQGKSVAYWDERFDDLDEFDALVKDAVEVGVSAFTGTQAGRAARLLQRAKRLKPSILGAVGGHHARILPQQVEAEPFVDKVYAKAPYGEELFPYAPHTKKHWARTELQYFTSRGCPYACSFCALRSDWVPRPLEQIDRELKTLHHDLGFTEVSFSDPNIATGVSRTEAGITRMDRVGRMRDIGGVMQSIGAKWDGNMRSPYLTPEMIDALVYSQCFSLEIGCESGDDYFLKKVIRKGHGVDAIQNAARNMRGSGISVIFSFITGMPRETPDMRRRTFDLIDWIVDTNAEARVSVYQFAPYPGSPMYDDAVAGADGFPVFEPPTTMEGWGNLRLMRSAAYWIAGLNFRNDNTRKNFPGEDWALIEPYVRLAQAKWAARDVDDFPVEELEALVAGQVVKRHAFFAERYVGLAA